METDRMSQQESTEKRVFCGDWLSSSNKRPALPVGLAVQPGRTQATAPLGSFPCPPGCGVLGGCPDFSGRTCQASLHGKGRWPRPRSAPAAGRSPGGRRRCARWAVDPRYLWAPGRPQPGIRRGFWEDRFPGRGVGGEMALPRHPDPGRGEERAPHRSLPVRGFSWGSCCPRCRRRCCCCGAGGTRAPPAGPAACWAPGKEGGTGSFLDFGVRCFVSTFERLWLHIALRVSVQISVGVPAFNPFGYRPCRRDGGYGKTQSASSLRGKLENRRQ